MKNDEAIKHLTSLRIHSQNRRLDKDIEALDKAIEVLEQQTCEDTVSRQAVLDIIMPYCKDDDGSVENTGDLRNALDDIESLPPITPQPKIGHWIYTGDYITDGMLKCSSCGYEHDVADRFLYCPNCGRKMQEVEE